MVTQHNTTQHYRLLVALGTLVVAYSLICVSFVYLRLHAYPHRRVSLARPPFHFHHRIPTLIPSHHVSPDAHVDTNHIAYSV
jgi:hypothetical protein